MEFQALWAFLYSTALFYKVYAKNTPYHFSLLKFPSPQENCWPKNQVNLLFLSFGHTICNSKALDSKTVIHSVFSCTTISSSCKKKSNKSLQIQIGELIWKKSKFSFVHCKGKHGLPESCSKYVLMAYNFYYPKNRSNKNATYH